MKTYLSLIILLFLMCNTTLIAQQDYTVDSQNYSLNTKVEGSLTLLWNTIDGEYRYFSKKGDEIVELKNTKQDGTYQEEYKETLRMQTADATVSTNNIKLTLPSLKSFFNEYNRQKDPNFTEPKKAVALKFRLGGFAGISNTIFTENPNNEFLPVLGVDLEMIDAVKLKRHAMVLRFKQTFKNNEYKYSASQFSLNYRFKFVKSPKLDVYANCKFVAFTFFKEEDVIIGYHPDDNPIFGSISGNDFSAPVTFGLGADYMLGNGYLTFNYNDIVGLSVDSNGEFPIDFTLGYKFNL